MEKRKLIAIILAAGQGKRMKSPLPKVLHPVAGEPMVARVIDEIKKCGVHEVRVVVGVGKELTEPIITQKGALFFEQKEQLGTGHAVLSAGFETLEGDVLIVNGDHPLLKSDELKRALDKFKSEGLDLAVLSCKLPLETQFGRIVRNKGKLQAIVEVKDASAETLKINEMNTGIYLVRSELLKKHLPQVEAHNVQKEIYLTDIIALAVENKKQVDAIEVDEDCAFGVNDQIQLAEASKRVVLRKVHELMLEGVMVFSPDSVYIEDHVQVGAGSVIYPGVFLKGKTKIGSFCVVEPNCFILNSTIGDSVQIKMGSYIDNAVIKNKAGIGPYAHIRPETTIGEEARVGNFVELKKVQMGDRSKASHLTYLGDAKIGTDTNIGCGTITCNYAVDKKKYETVIGNNVFVGSDSQLVAPVKIGDNAVIGSGSTITKNVPENALGIARGRQTNIENYAGNKKSEKSKK